MFGNVERCWGSFRADTSKHSPICEIGLIPLTAIGLLGCAFMIYRLTRWVRKGTGKTPTTRKVNIATNPGQPFLVGTGNADKTGSVARTCREGHK